MINITLVEPTKDMKSKADNFIRSFFNNGENTINGSCGIARFCEYDEWIMYIREVSKGIRNDRIPSSTFFAIDKTTDEIVGIIDIRHFLNEEHYYSGHIGYSVSPNNRCKGFGSEILKLGLEKAKLLGLRKVLLTCEKNNVASIRVIQNNNGILEKEYMEDENAMLAYYIYTG
jgi:predicted acetyltransferase